MAEHSTSPESEPEPVVTFEHDYLYISTGRPFGEGETIAKGIVLFYDRESPDEVVGLSIRCAPVVLKPLLDAVLAEASLTLDQQAPEGAMTVRYRAKA